MSGELSPLAGQVCLGWQFTPALPDPGEPPARPALVPLARLDPSWIAAQQRIAASADRPARVGVAVVLAAVVLLGGAWLGGLVAGSVAACWLLVAAGGGAACGRSSFARRRRLAAVLAAEYERVAVASAAQERGLAIAQREHASEFRAWQRRKATFDRQPAWFAVALPSGIDRVDVAGGTLAGWAAMLTMIAAPRLLAGAEVTVVDLTEAAVAADLLALAERSGIEPLVWVLPGDLARLDVGTGLDAAALADILTLAASAVSDTGRAGGQGGDRPAADQAADCALLERVLGALGPQPLIAQVTAALRLLADVGDPRADLRAGLISTAQVERLGTLFGKTAADRMVIERAFALEARLRRLDWLGAEQQPVTPTRLRVAALDRRSGVIGNRMIATYLVAALTHLLRQAAPARTEQARPWAHALCVLGAERLGGDLLDRLTDACETSRTGLVLAFRAIPPGVRERLGRGNAAMAFMRLGNGDEAKAASELIGTEHRFVVGQLTDTIGSSVTDTWGDSYTSGMGTADSIAHSLSVNRSSGNSRGRGRSHSQGHGPFGDFNSSASRDISFSLGESDTTSLTEGINTSTSWGISTSRALGESASLGRTAQRSREFLVEAGELQRLPHSAMIVSYPCQAGRQVILADANPAIVALAGDQRPGRWQTQVHGPTIQPG